MNRFHIAVAASALALTSASAFAADFPQSGATKATGYLTGSSVEGLDGWATGSNPEIYVQSGVVRGEKDGGPFDKMYLRCIGQDVSIAGKISDNGACTETDKAGDMIFESYGSDGFTFVGGTGKFKGITGGGTGKLEMVFEGAKNWPIIATWDKHWEIK